ncbi:hypothetical protein JOQ06_011422, partial [Pogonophryne albipinna]
MRAPMALNPNRGVAIPLPACPLLFAHCGTVEEQGFEWTGGAGLDVCGREEHLTVHCPSPAMKYKPTEVTVIDLCRKTPSSSPLVKLDGSHQVDVGCECRSSTVITTGIQRSERKDNRASCLRGSHEPVLPPRKETFVTHKPVSHDYTVQTKNDNDDSISEAGGVELEQVVEETTEIRSAAPLRAGGVWCL